MNSCGLRAMATTSWLVVRGFLYFTFRGGNGSTQEVGYRACDGRGDIDVRDQFPDHIVKVGVWE